MNDLPSTFDQPVRLYDAVFRRVNECQSIFLLLLRFYIGYQSIVPGLGHLQNIDDTTKYFASLHIPMPRLNVYIAAGTEVVGGLFLMLGLMSRLVSLPFAFNFVVAIFMANWFNADRPEFRDMLKNILHNQDVVLKDDAFPFLFAGVLIFFFGAGKFSLDYIFLRPWFHGVWGRRGLARRTSDDRAFP